MDIFMNVLPVERPEITITPNRGKTFDIKAINEVPWMYCDLRVGKSITWGIYDPPEWKLTDCAVSSTIREARIHGIDCVEIKVKDYDNPYKKEPDGEYNLYVHAGEEMIQYVAKSAVRKGRYEFISLYDDEFIKNYGGEESSTIKDKGFGVYVQDDLMRVEAISPNDSLTMGAGVFDLTIKDKLRERSFECLRVLDRSKDNPMILVENYMSREGRTVLFRRYNHPLWKLERYKQRWDEKFPEAQRITLSGEEYIHWYDCLSDYVLNESIPCGNPGERPPYAF
jgi:hypothetical protein